jgi:PKD repeat protein
MKHTLLRFATCLVLVVQTYFITAQLPPLQNKSNGENKSGYVAQQLEMQIAQNGIKRASSPFDYLPENAQIPGLRNKIESASFLRLIPTEVQYLLQFKPKTLSIPLVLADGTKLELELYEKSVFSKDAVIRTSDGTLSTPQQNVHYRGVVKGQEGSLVGLSFYPDEVIGVVNTETHGTLVIGLLDGQRDIHVIYQTEHLDAPADFTCGVHADSEEGEEDDDAGHRRGGFRALDDCIRVYIEADFALFQNKGGTNQTINYVTGIFNNVLIIYNNEQINAEISEIFVWTTLDSYSRSSANTALNQFRSARQNFNGNLAHLFALGGNGLGGVAYVNVLCNKPNAFAYSNISASYQNYPTYSWTIMVVTHEMGHNVGSNHTHWCGWQGGAIDNCYQTEGGCPSGPAPQGGGTVMSYCHLTNFGINLTKGFGPLPGNLIRTRVTNAWCLFECSDICENLTAEFNVQHTTCNLNNGIIEVAPSGGKSPYRVNIGNGFVQQTVFQNLPSGFYTIVVRDDNACEVEYVIEVEGSVAPILQIEVTHTSCGEYNGELNLSVNSGTPPFLFDIGNGFNPQSRITNLAPGVYEIEVLDSQGCFGSDVAVIEESDFFITDISVRHTTCGNNNGRIEILILGGGTAPFQYSVNGNYRQSPVFDSLPPGAYFVEAIDAEGCFALMNTTINSSQGILFNSVVVPSACGGANGSVSINVTQGVAPFTYSLNGVNQASNIFSNLAAGTYTAMVTDSSGCTRTAQVVVTSSNALALTTIVEGAWCGVAQGRIVVHPQNGQSPFEFDFGAGFIPQNYAENLAAGTYTVTVVDNSGCSATIQAIVEGSPGVDINVITTPSSCNINDGTVLINASGGTGNFTYTLNGISQQVPLFTQLPAGVYLAVAIDSLGCSDTALAVVQSLSGLNVNAQVQGASCGIANGVVTANASGGTAPYQYALNQTVQQNGVFQNLEPGIYSLVVTDANGCSFNSQVLVLGYPQIILHLEFENTTCGAENGSAEIQISGGNGQYNYFLNGVQVNSSIFTDLAAGNYLFRVNDSAGCEDSISFVIQPSSAMSVNIVVTFSSCENPNGAIEVNVSGGYPPYSYDLGNGAQNAPRFQGLTSGGYTLFITDSLNCKIERAINVGNDGEKPIASFRAILNGNEVLFFNNSKGSPDSFQWQFGDGQGSAEPNPRHTYEDLKDYQVCLTVKNECGENTSCRTINVNGDRDCVANDSLALVALFESTNGLEWTNSWDLSTPVQTWFGLTFDQGGCLIRIELSDNNLVGELPETIGNFLTLKVLNLSQNNIRGTLRDELFNLLTLEQLDLSANAMDGSVNAGMDELINLTMLNLRENELTGSLPLSMYKLSNLRYLDISYNQLSGKLLSQFSGLSSIQYANFSSNRFEGLIPEEICQLTRLRYFYVANNDFSGAFPECFAQKDTMYGLWISGNRFNRIPDFNNIAAWIDQPADGLQIGHNELTFRYILANMSVFNSLLNSAYAPQAKVYKDTTLLLRFDETLLLDIDVDRGVPGTQYTWYKNGQIYYQSAEPVLRINNAQLTDQGFYYCEIRNTNAPALTLQSHNIQVDINTSTKDGVIGWDVHLSPNPVRAGDAVGLRVSGIDGSLAVQTNYEIVDLKGVTINRGTMAFAGNEDTIWISSPVVPGLYLIRISDTSGALKVFKMVVF